MNRKDRHISCPSHRANWLPCFFAPSLALFAQSPGPVRLSIDRAPALRSTAHIAAAPPGTARAVPCGWAVLPDGAHPEWPRHIAPAAGTRSCSVSASTAAVRARSRLAMVRESAGNTVVLDVIALEDGVPGKVIRCRSSFSSALLLGRVLDDKTVEWVSGERSDRW